MIEIRSPFLLVSIADARAHQDRRRGPSINAWTMPPRPMMKPPVGKSGPGISEMRCLSFSPRESVTSSPARCVFSISQMQPSTTSRRLCGGTLVAMPTAMPADAVDQEIRKRRGKNRRLFGRLVVVRREIDGLFVEIRHHVVGERLQPRFRYRMAAGGSPSIDPKLPCPSTSG